mmetsp:Transcript_136151/g.236662  ORF Transcript_136151/g.236662 Transcript_136151/m.236662 type:complete len:655 (-) Transcript_136151:223-2187(-)
MVSCSLVISLLGCLTLHNLGPAHSHNFGQKVQSVETHSELVTLLRDAGPRPVIVMFWTEKCGFCHMIMPFFEEQAQSLADRAHFRKVNIRTNPESAAVLDADGLPNFKFILKGKTVKSFRGASVEALEKYVKQVIEQADQDDIIVTRDDLVSYFEEYDKEVASSPESIDMLWETGKQNVAKMLELLEAQYGAKPRYSGGFIASKDVTGASGRQDKVVRPNAELKQLDKERATRTDQLENRCPKSVSSDRSAPEHVVILGGGPAGASAALYAGRAMLCPVVISPQLGGQLMAKGVDVENYPGLPQAMGGEIVAAMRSQATSFHSRFVDDAVIEVNFAKKPFMLKTNTSGTIFADSVILATGATSRMLGVPGESRLHGKGVSGCATCDGYLHRGKTCLVVGGGDAALEDALHLTRICTSVTLVHRRGAFRAGQGLQLQVLNNKAVQVRWNTEVKAFHGDDKAGLERAVLRSVQTGALEELAVGAAFVAIGHDPNTKQFQGQLDMDAASGYIACKGRTTHTSVPGVFAAGDVADSRYRQAVTSAGSGAAAALDAERWLAEHMPHSSSQAGGSQPTSSAEVDDAVSSLHERLLIAMIFLAFALGQASESKFGMFRRLLRSLSHKASSNHCDAGNEKHSLSELTSKPKPEKIKNRGKAR